MTDNKKIRFAAHVLMCNCDQFILLMLDNCGPFVEKIFVGYSEKLWNYNSEARNNFKNHTSKDILKQSKYYNKIEIIEGEWEKDEDERNACLNKAKSEGFDYLIIQDADEYYKMQDYQTNLEEISQNLNYDLYIMPMSTFWKSLDYILVDKNGSVIDAYPGFAINCKSNVKFIYSRNTNADSIFKLSGVCYHLSYVYEDNELYQKISTWGHASDFNRERWFKYKWLRWNESTRDLHPLYRDFWIRAIRFSGKLPEVLEDFQSPLVKQYNGTSLNKIEYAIVQMVTRITDEWKYLKIKLSNKN